MEIAGALQTLAYHHGGLTTTIPTLALGGVIIRSWLMLLRTKQHFLLLLTDQFTEARFPSLLAKTFPRLLAFLKPLSRRHSG